MPIGRSCGIRNTPGLARVLPSEIAEVLGHRLKIVGYQDAPGSSRIHENFRIRNVVEAGCLRTPKIDRWLPSDNRANDGLVEVIVRLEANPHLGE